MPIVGKTIPPSMRLEDINPAIAWETWEPSPEEPWDHRRASLLHRRAGFGASQEELKATLSMGSTQAVDRLLGGASQDKDILDAFQRESSELARSVLAKSDAKQLAAWWLHRMLNTPLPLVEKMTLFWHGHFATGAEKVQDAELMYIQNKLLRENSLGSFRNLAQGIAKDPAMLIYLDSVSNRKAHANENFARELMELFCLGEGNYTESDVQQLAKCFTGWEIRRTQFRFNPYQHDETLKNLLGTTGLESGESAIDCVLASPHMPRFIAHKLFRFFISDDTNPSPELLATLTERFKETNYSIQSIVELILRSRLLLSGWSIGRKVRSPIELVIGWMRTMQCTSNIGFVSERLRSLGQAVFFPPNVKGWEGGRSWINSSTLIGRANLIYELIHNENTRYDGATLNVFANRIDASDQSQLATWFTKHFLVSELSVTENEQLAKLHSTPKPIRWQLDTLVYLASLPQIHLS